ncbi:MAG: hydantoinase B/oxoprolinase family protein [Clostridiales bacterium]|nr:hydantoinase B/oxoprolinase family protein [Clostridiales bacterium]
MSRKIVDPVTVEVVRNLLLSIAEETNTVIIKSAYSTNIKERRDNSAAVMDPDGNVVVQVESSLPVLLAALLFTAKSVRAKYRIEDIREGDMFIANDPYHGGGNHLPDIAIVAPAFVGGKLVGWVGNIAHHSDIGGKVPGSTSGDAVSLFQEGIRIPVVRICRGGEINDDVMALLLDNTRVPDERQGDLTAQISANLIGVEKLKMAYGKYGDTLIDCMEDILNYTDKLMRSVIRRIPDGEYSFVDYVDGCGALVPHPININVKITVSGEAMKLDFDGTHPQVEAPINIPFPALMAAVLFSLKALIGPELPANVGIFRPLDIQAPVGCIVNPREPAPIGLLIDSLQRLPDVLFGALAPVMPERILASSNGACTTCVFFGQSMAKGKDQYFVCHEAIAGGSGASHFHDGLSGVQVYMTNTSNMPIEATEYEFPDIMVKKYILRPDSGGAGKFRGGLGIEREYTVLSDGISVNCFGDRQKFQPWGLEGGMSGEAGRFFHIDAETGETKVLSHKTTGMPIKKGDVIRVHTPGSGGMGDPKKQPPEKVLKDVMERKVSLEAAERDYGVRIERDEAGGYKIVG